ncbi:hypothetical protein GCM10009540_15640 [Streptomyces turgidiscabies]
MRGGADTGSCGEALRVQVTTAHALLQQLRKISHPLLLPRPDHFIRFTRLNDEDDEDDEELDLGQMREVIFPIDSLRGHT